MKLEVLRAVPGAGKTKAILTDILNSKNRCVIASISKNLSRNSYNFYRNVLKGQAEIVDTSHVNGSVSDAIKDSPSRVIFITHTALLNLDLEVFEGRDLYIDEVPELVSLESYRFKDNFDVLEKYCDVDYNSETSGSLVIKKGKKAKVKAAIKDGLGESDCVSEVIYPILSSAYSELPIRVQKDEESTTVFFIKDNTTNDWDKLNKVTIACANFEQTFTGKVLKHWSKWELVESKLNKHLDFYQYPNTNRVTIYPMCDQNWGRAVADTKHEDETVYIHMVSNVQHAIGDQSYMYTTNKSRPRHSNHSSATLVPYNPHGLNSYMTQRNVVALFHYNPMPWQVPILKQLSVMAGLQENELVEAFVVSKYMEPIFQLCTRCAIRDITDRQSIKLFVPDIRCAEYLVNEYIQGASVNKRHMITVPERKRKQRVVKSIPALLGMTNNERASWYYHCKKKPMNIENPKHIKYAKEWLNVRRQQKIT